MHTESHSDVGFWRPEWFITKLVIFQLRGLCNEKCDEKIAMNS